MDTHSIVIDETKKDCLMKYRGSLLCKLIFYFRLFKPFYPLAYAELLDSQVPGFCSLNGTFELMGNLYPAKHA